VLFAPGREPTTRDRDIVCEALGDDEANAFLDGAPDLNPVPGLRDVAEVADDTAVSFCAAEVVRDSNGTSP